MRRADREVTDHSQLMEILSHITECHLALVDGGKPYGVTLNFAYEETPRGLVLYFHCAQAGRKLNCLRAVPFAYFFAEAKTRFEERRKPDGSAYFTMLYESIAGEGRIEEITDDAEKRRCLGLLVKRFSETPMKLVSEAIVHVTCVLRMTLSSLTGKRH